MAWFLNPALTNFRTAVDLAYPPRDRASDGTIGNLAHQLSVSDHNPDPDGSVDAWDMDVEVNGAGKPCALDLEVLKIIFEAHESSLYWIHVGQIASRDSDWKRVPYVGASPHNEHVHWNTRESHENSQKPWGLPVVFYDELKKAVLEALKTPVPYVSGGVKEAAAVAGEGSISLRKAVEYLLEDVRFDPRPAVATVDMEAVRAVVREELNKTKLGDG